jgi:hypothetical protein
LAHLLFSRASQPVLYSSRTASGAGPGEDERAHRRVQWRWHPGGRHGRRGCRVGPKLQVGGSGRGELGSFHNGGGRGGNNNRGGQRCAK